MSGRRRRRRRRGGALHSIFHYIVPWRVSVISAYTQMAITFEAFEIET